MNILLIQPPHYYEGKDREVKFFPIGLGYIAKAIIEEGHTVKVLDINAAHIPRNQVADIIKTNSFEVIGISAMSTQYNYVKWLAETIKMIDSDIVIILGGLLSTYSYRVVLENTHVDICVIREGEITIKELLRNLNKYEAVDGTAFNKNGVIVKNNGRKYMKNLDTLTYPAYELFPMEKYINSLNVIGVDKKLRTINLIIGRGCPYNCNFCSKSYEGIRLRSIDSIIEEIKYLKENYAIEGIGFVDECLVINRDRIWELCEKIQKIKLAWSCQGRANLVDDELLFKMKSAGCTAVGYGIESGSQKILDAMNKKTTVKQAKQAILATQKAGLCPVIQMMFGYPGEDEETLQETVNFFRDIDHPGSELSPTTPLPGSKLWQDSLNKGFIKSEREFLEKLEGGYMSDAPILVNYTAFPTEQLNLIRNKTEQQIKRNYMVRHPFLVSKDYIRRLNFNLESYGIKATLIKVMRRLLQLPAKDVT